MFTCTQRCVNNQVKSDKRAVFISQLMHTLKYSWIPESAHALKLADNKKAEFNTAPTRWRQSTCGATLKLMDFEKSLEI